MDIALDLSSWFPASCTQGGVVILISLQCSDELFLGKDSRGRIISILIRRSDVGVNLGNIYAPTNLTEQKNFFDSFHKFFIPSSAIIITGDFNCYNNALDKFSENVSIHREYKSLKSDFVHADVWHNWYPSAREFTWFDSTLSIGSRLGKFFYFWRFIVTWRSMWHRPLLEFSA